MLKFLFSSVCFITLSTLTLNTATADSIDIYTRTVTKPYRFNDFNIGAAETEYCFKKNEIEECVDSTKLRPKHKPNIETILQVMRAPTGIGIVDPQGGEIELGWVTRDRVSNPSKYLDNLSGYEYPKQKPIPCTGHLCHSKYKIVQFEDPSNKKTFSLSMCLVDHIDNTEGPPYGCFDVYIKTQEQEFYFVSIKSNYTTNTKHANIGSTIFDFYLISKNNNTENLLANFLSKYGYVIENERGDILGISKFMVSKFVEGYNERASIRFNIERRSFEDYGPNYNLYGVSVSTAVVFSKQKTTGYSYLESKIDLFNKKMYMELINHLKQRGCKEDSIWDLNLTGRFALACK